MLRAENVTVRYDTHTVVDRLSFSLEEGQWLMLAGPNGVGGITVRGNVSDVTVRTDKKGYLYYGMNVQGIGISARVDIMLIPGTDRASVTVDPNYSSNRITMEGRVLPAVDSRVFKGRFH